MSRIQMELTILLAGGERRSMTVSGDRATIGRRSDCDICIDSKAVSRIHAELVQLRNGGWEVRDLDSLNGVEVGGKPVRKCRLHDGDEILIGDARIFVGAAPHDDSTIIVSRHRKEAGLWLDADHRCLRYGARQLGDRLAPREYALLRLLADASGHVVERRAIEESLWGADAYDDNALHQLVRRTREKIRDDAGVPRILVTLPGVGYRIDLGATIE
jgi:hypothetical protein